MPLWMVLTAALASSPAPPLALTHDNTHSAGTRQNDRLTVRLVAGAARWQPEGAHGVSLDVAAFGEEDKPLTIPAPLLRAPVGTSLDVSVRNTLDAALHVHGLCSRPGPCDPIDVRPGEVRDVSLRIDQAGTYGTGRRRPSIRSSSGTAQTASSEARSSSTTLGRLPTGSSS